MQTRKLSGSCYLWRAYGAIFQGNTEPGDFMATNVACVSLCHAALWSSSRMCTCKCVRIWKNQCLACRGISLIQPQINSVLFYLWRLQVWISQKLIDSLKNHQETIHVAMPPSFLWRHGERAVKSLVFHQPWSALRLLGGKCEAARPGISCGRGSCAHGLPFWIHELLWFEIWGHSNLKSRNWCWCLGDPKGLKFPQARNALLTAPGVVPCFGITCWRRNGSKINKDLRNVCCFTCICMYLHTHTHIYFVHR